MGPELDLRPQLERLDRLICWSEDIDEGALTFAFRPLWQLDEPARAALALQKAQATQVYAGLKLWPDAVMARLAEAQLVADGTYPNAAAVFTESGATTPSTVPAKDYSPSQPRDPDGRWTRWGHTFELSEANSSFAEAVRKAAGAAGGETGGAEKLAVTTKDFRGAYRALRLDPKEASKAPHAAKKAAGLAGDDNCLFDTTTGDILFNGESIGNLGD